MSLYDWIKTVFDAPSRRRNADYSKEISSDGVFAVLLLYRDYFEGEGQAQFDWMPKVLGEMAHLHHELAARSRNLGFEVLSEFLLNERTATSAFLDFLEISLRNRWGPIGDNDFVDAVNRVLEEYDSPYLLTRYVVKVTIRPSGYGVEQHHVHYDSFPQAYLKQDTIAQREAIEPALDIFADPAYASPADDFRKALSRDRSGDYGGCVTSCAAAVEGTIKVAAARLKWKSVKGDGLGRLAQSFVSKSSLPDALETLFRPLAVYRSTNADAHGQVDRHETSQELARFFIAHAASLIMLVHSEVD